MAEPKGPNCNPFIRAGLWTFLAGIVLTMKAIDAWQAASKVVRFNRARRVG